MQNYLSFPFFTTFTNTKIAEFANNVDADESADNEFSSGSREFVLKSLIFHQHAVYSLFFNLQIYLGFLALCE